MSRKAIFEGLMIDEFDQPVSVAYVGEEPCYVVDDAGFMRHIASEDVDRQVLDQMKAMIEGNEDLLAGLAAKQLGQDDIFSKAIIEKQLKNAEQYFQNLIDVGLPEEARAYLGMMGFRIRINVHGEVLEVEQPGMIDPDEE
jgi:hypothetical protein